MCMLLRGKTRDRVKIKLPVRDKLRLKIKLGIVKLINYSFITALSAVTSANPHLRNPLFTSSLYYRSQPSAARQISPLINHTHSASNCNIKENNRIVRILLFRKRHNDYNFIYFTIY